MHDTFEAYRILIFLWRMAFFCGLHDSMQKWMPTFSVGSDRTPSGYDEGAVPLDLILSGQAEGDGERVARQTVPQFDERDVVVPAPVSVVGVRDQPVGVQGESELLGAPPGQTDGELRSRHEAVLRHLCSEAPLSVLYILPETETTRAPMKRLHIIPHFNIIPHSLY
ncbi:hypothetical protein CDAR_73141 [Caerostris darwini]|uniref:Uncharacterized protein n=1 Tax=Caerostris darwini TaxID=1538125 RepID=A0AAV4VX21_9ARAC|nr:hypothetical protein CDAR_73141 [Caerostris darwini]